MVKIFNKALHQTLVRSKRGFMDIKAQLKQIQDKGLYREFQPIQSVEKQYIYINDQSLY